MAYIISDSDMIYYSRELYHHGIKGQKWGTRRFQNEDGSLTTLGRQRYYPNSKNDVKNAVRAYQKEVDRVYKNGLPTNDQVKNSRLKELRKKTGSNAITRTINNIKYNPDRLKKQNDEKKAVKEYQKKYKKLVNKANKQFEKNYKTVSDNWNSLGKSEVGRRMKSTFKKNDPSVVAWKKSVDKMMTDSRTARQEWNDSNIKEMYARTGHNAISRIVNNIKYDTMKK